ncbi:uncharacterized protein N7484_011930 [Penicillium longicatenatum]|uniref:uncharacterized protein n=1 Tax=Penicillium longicatenatum TaxID=1561947 RepID=UPI002548594F|nr:uncharacterized protein N7484_011930 [Penicillium longicatenatum]KAJ5631830.1 hypothetical protein N7484_011930 [Penicillium longicatenatum]
MSMHEEAEISSLTEIRNGTPSDMTNFSDFNQLFDVSESLNMTPVSHSFQTAHSHTSSDIISPRLLSLDFSAIFPGLVTPNSMDFNQGIKMLEPQLSQRWRSLQQGSMTAKMIFSRMSDYGRMMADAKSLPSFIHPPCCVGSGEECSSDAAHGCLSEALAYDGYDEGMKLQALQAALVYGMLCAQCTESVSIEDSTWVVETIETFAEELYDLGIWTLDTDQPHPSRSHWVFVESLRR